MERTFALNSQIFVYRILIQKYYVYFTFIHSLFSFSLLSNKLRWIFFHFFSLLFYFYFIFEKNTYFFHFTLNETERIEFLFTHSLDFHFNIFFTFFSFTFLVIFRHKMNIFPLSNWYQFSLCLVSENLCKFYGCDNIVAKKPNTECVVKASKGFPRKNH